MLTYERLDAAHAPLLFDALGDPEVWRYIGDPDATTVEELAAAFARRAAGPPPGRPPGERWVNFAVASDGVFCGRVEATVHGEWAEIAYLLGPRFWGRGIAQEAVAWLCAHLREHHEITELWAATRADNARSRRLLERLGFALAPPIRHLLSADPGDVLYRL